MSKERNIETFTADWNGIGVQITWEPSWLSLDSLGYDTAHLQVESNRPERVQLPITETGYRSHFIAASAIAAAGGPAAYVDLWLAAESDAPAWRKHEEATRQLVLF